MTYINKYPDDTTINISHSFIQNKKYLKFKRFGSFYYSIHPFRKIMVDYIIIYEKGVAHNTIYVVVFINKCDENIKLNEEQH